MKPLLLSAALALLLALLPSTLQSSGTGVPVGDRADYTALFPLAYSRLGDDLPLMDPDFAPLINSEAEFTLEGADRSHIPDYSSIALALDDAEEDRNPLAWDGDL